MMYQYPYQMQLPQMNGQSLIRVNGIDGAKAYQIGAGQTVALFDSNADVFYVKSTDMAGFPSIRVFKFEEVRMDAPTTATANYVTREELEAYVKQFIQPKSKKSSNGNQSSTDADD